MASMKRNGRLWSKRMARRRSARRQRSIRFMESLELRTAPGSFLPFLPGLLTLVRFPEIPARISA